MKLFKLDDGFTLIELLAVISIIGIITSVAIPLVGQSMNRWRMDQFTRSVVSGLRSASFRAHNKPIQVRYDVANDQVSFLEWTGGNEYDLSVAANWAQPEGMFPIKGRSGVNLVQVGFGGGGDNAVHCQVFLPDGTATRPIEAPGDNSCDPGGGGEPPGIIITNANNTNDDLCNARTIWVYTQAAKVEMLQYEVQNLAGGNLSPPGCF